MQLSGLVLTFELYAVQIAYTSRREVSIFDIVYNSSQPAEVLRWHDGSTYATQFLSDVAFVNGGTRVLASDSYCGVINVWDRRVSDLPQIGFTSSHINSAPCGVTSIQLLGDQYIYGACKNGFINIWDLRGGRSVGSLRNNEVVYLF
ncbi:putative transcription factor WD40-like family [Helianthus anomalus]